MKMSCRGPGIALLLMMLATTLGSDVTQLKDEPELRETLGVSAEEASVEAQGKLKVAKAAKQLAEKQYRDTEARVQDIKNQLNVAIQSHQSAKGAHKRALEKSGASKQEIDQATAATAAAAKSGAWQAHYLTLYPSLARLRSRNPLLLPPAH